MMQSSWFEHRAPQILVAASFVNIALLLIAHIGGDIFFQETVIRCFANQFWQGDLMPNWCMSANGGIGSPVLIFYFPLPLYIASMFYPLTWAGVSFYRFYCFCCFLATLVTAFGSYRWLKEITSAKSALLATLLLLFAPYRMEVMMFRVAYAELWCIALLPWLFLYVRRIVQGRGGEIPCTLIIAAMLLTHEPCAAFGGLFAGIYALALRPRSAIRYGVCAIVGAAISGFHSIPAFYYRRFISGEGVTDEEHRWANSFFSVDNFYNQWRESVAVTLVLVILLAVAAFVSRKHKRLPTSFLQREAYVWCSMMALAFFLFVPLSSALYTLHPLITSLFLPWRIQCIFILAIGYFAAISLEWLLSDKRRKTLKADYALILGMLLLIANFSMSIFGGTQALYERLIKTYALTPEYRTEWTDKNHMDYNYVTKHLKEDKPNAEIIQGNGVIKTNAWSWRGIALSIDAKTPLTIRLDQYYFPNWVIIGDTAGATLTPEEGTGQLMLTAPKGHYDLTLATNIKRANSQLVTAGWAVTALGLLILGIFAAMRKKSDDSAYPA